MDPRDSVYILLFLFGILHTFPIKKPHSHIACVPVPKNVDITTTILESNKASSVVLIEGDLVLHKTRNALICFNNSCFWTKNSSNLVEVPYIMSSDYFSAELSVIQNAMATFQNKTCVRFVPRTSQTDYLSIENQVGCYSFLGKIGGKQVVSLQKNSCVFHGIIQHELIHALGFYHEHTRSDRDQYVRINWANIIPNMAYNFQKQNTNNLNTTYDYESIMHYGRTTFSIGPGLDTITPIPNATVEIGQNQEMSEIDILRINKLYGC